MTTVHSVPPSIDSPVLREIFSDIAADARRRRDLGGARPARALALIREHRLGAVRVPRELGGGGYSKRDLFRLIIDLGRADPDIPHILRLHFGFVEEVIGARGARPDQSGWIQSILAGNLFGGVGSELSGRPGVYRFDTTLTRLGDSYRLNGAKYYSTGSLYADYLRISATDENGETISAIVPADRRGIDHVDDWDGIGQRETGSGTTLLKDVEVHPEELSQYGPHVRGPGKVGGAQPQLLLHAIAAGILAAIVDDAADHLRARTRSYAWGNTDESRHDPQLLSIVGWLSSVQYVVESAVLAAADAQHRSAEHAITTGSVDDALELEASLAASRVKVAVEDLALRAAGEIFNVGGASWTRSAHHLDRHWRNLRTLFSHNPTAFKARAVGDHVVNQAPLPAVGFF